MHVYVVSSLKRGACTYTSKKERMHVYVVSSHNRVWSLGFGEKGSDLTIGSGSSSNDLIAGSIQFEYDPDELAAKITTHLVHISYQNTVSGTNLSNIWTYRVSIMNSHRD